MYIFQGSGWWKYEICYNKYIRQVHKEKGKPDEIVVLGVFNIEDHINWLSQNEERKPKLDSHGVRQSISHFYSSGSICQKTGEKRETEVNMVNCSNLINYILIIFSNIFQVRYKCVKGRHNEDSVALYLLEPKTCKYILTIESPSLCEIINGPIDEYGIFNIKPRSDIPSEKLKPQFDDTQNYEENVQKKGTISDVDQESEKSDDSKKMGKIEL